MKPLLGISLLSSFLLFGATAFAKENTNQFSEYGVEVIPNETADNFVGLAETIEQVLVEDDYQANGEEIEPITVGEQVINLTELSDEKITEVQSEINSENLTTDFENESDQALGSEFADYSNDVTHGEDTNQNGISVVENVTENQIDDNTRVVRTETVTINSDEMTEHHKIVTQTYTTETVAYTSYELQTKYVTVYKRQFVPTYSFNRGSCRYVVSYRCTIIPVKVKQICCVPVTKTKLIENVTETVEEYVVESDSGEDSNTSYGRDIGDGR